MNEVNENVLACLRVLRNVILKTKSLLTAKMLFKIHLMTSSSKEQSLILTRKSHFPNLLLLLTTPYE